MGIHQLLMSSGDRIRLDAATISRAATGAATAQFRLGSDGQAYYADDSSSGFLTARYNWVEPPGNAALYDCRWTQGAGAVDTSPGAVSTNLNLGTNRTWQETNGTGVESTTFTVTIHRTGDTGNALATAIITLEADGS